MYKSILTAFLILFGGSVLAQLKVSGVVRDSTGRILEAANVIAVNQTSQIIESYQITNAKGEYKLNIRKNSAYKLSVNYLGMKSIQVELQVKDADLNQDFNMIPDAKSLDEFKVVQRIPFKVNGDTMTYDAESFKHEADRKLEDVLRRLPGVDVDREGNIKVEGKAVSEIKIEGKRFFDDSTKLASKNIPVGVLDKIQVLKNDDNVDQLSGVRDNSEHVTINIKLKEGKNNFWFGDVGLAGGPKDRYFLHPKLFYYSPKKSANLILDVNNIGDAPLLKA